MRPILPLLAFLALAFPVDASHCTTWSTSRPEIDVPPGGMAGGARIYVDNDPCQICMFSIWVYEESNGIDGLQREDEVVDDTCHGMIDGDTIVF